jgi:hypothetical protein
MVWCGVMCDSVRLLLLFYCESSQYYIESSIVILLLLSVLNAVAYLKKCTSLQ